MQKRLKSDKSSGRTFRYGFFIVNFIILVGLIVFIAAKSGSSSSVAASALNSTTVGNGVNDPLDQLSSADIALTVARVTNLPEATAVKDQDESVNAELALVPTDTNIAVRSQVVSTTFKSNKDIQSYTVQPGDTIASLAAKFNITSSSISWSNNNLSGLTVGSKILIPPVSGIVYTVKAGDTPQSLAATYGANQTQLIAYNDAEISGLNPGEVIIIPNGQQPTGPTYNFFAAVYGGNGYDFGYCTWYVATQIPVPSNWGNASSWAYYAALSGWNVSSIPTVGAIAQTGYAAGGEGHVAIVTGVSPDGTQIQYKDMNGIAGWDRIGYSGWVSASTYQHYISH